MEPTWMPHEKHGRLTRQSDLPDSVFAFPNQRKEPLTDAQHVRNAVARFDQVIGVSDADRAFGFDYSGSGALDCVVVYRPGTGVIWILQNNGASFTAIYP